MVVNSEGLHIAVFEEGRSDGPTVLLVSGHPDSHTVWDPVVARLQDRFRIVRYDPRGVGDSSVPSGTAAYRVARLADDFAAVLAYRKGALKIQVVIVRPHCGNKFE